MFSPSLHRLLAALRARAHHAVRLAILCVGTTAFLASGLTAAVADSPQPQAAELRFPPQRVLEWVAHEMNVTLRPEEPLPQILLESRTPLQRFQRAIAAQWHFVPPRFANAYAVASNEIYLIDDAGYYRRLNRTIDDSLAHEFAHYLQVHYQNVTLAREDCETDAIAIQQAFASQHPALGIVSR